MPPMIIPIDSGLKFSKMNILNMQSNSDSINELILKHKKLLPTFLLKIFFFQILLSNSMIKAIVFLICTF